MRIRKRFPLPSLSSPPLSDPQLNRSPVVQHHPPQSNIQLVCDQTDSQPSDLPNQPPPPFPSQQMMIRREKPRWKVQQKEKELEGEEVKDGRWREELKSSNDTRKRSIAGSHQVIERWFEGDKVVPLKKRKMIMEKEKEEKKRKTKTKAKMKSKTNKKCLQQNGENQEERETKDDNENNNKKINKRGGEIMEGSRCSRVNGRGWRCCQQTLVGYSLCEHHLGKGRLRSIKSVRNATIAPPPLVVVQPKQEEKVVEEEEEEEKPLMVRKKRMKLGVVKARSISSILGQNDSNRSIS